MNLQEETEKMVKEATAKGLDELAEFQQAYDQFPKEDKTGLKDLVEEWLFKNGTPSIRPWCVNCKEPFPYSVPLVQVTTKGEVQLSGASFFRDHYFNSSVRYRICVHCQQTHPKAV